MGAGRESEPTLMKNRATVERKSERELVVTRTFNGPARIVFEAWTKPELLERWWVPKSTGMSLLSCEADVRVGGRYRFELGHQGSKPMAFFGRYIEVTPHSRLVWTNDESDDGAVTTVTFEEKGGKTLLVLHELYPSKEALDRAIGGMEGGGMPETFEQLDELLVALVEQDPPGCHPPRRFHAVTGLRSEKADYYRSLHADPWPGVLRRIRDSNIRNYSVAVKEIEGKLYLFSYFEYVGSDFASDMAAIAADPETQRWWKETDPCQIPLPDASSAGRIWSDAEELFYTNEV